VEVCKEKVAQNNDGLQQGPFNGGDEQKKNNRTMMLIAKISAK
jgi:hypothetical protein